VVLMQMQGIIRGRRIELEREPELPTGSVVLVQIQPKPLTLEEKRRLADALCGAWADDPSIPSVFEEIERQRMVTVPREVVFDATP
jgi:hypothetical protein